MVRLKPEFLYSSYILFISFQFLYGAIKTFKGGEMDAGSKMFQFLYGAIKTPEPQGTDNFLRRFNSSMVRLKLKSVGLCGLC